MSDVLSMPFLLRALYRGPVGSLDAGRGGLVGVSLQIFVKSERPSSMMTRGAVYSLDTSSFFLNSRRLTLGSLDKELRKNDDGSVDISTGPKPPTGQDSNWLYTPAGQAWFPWFRFYGPEKALFDKSWKMPDIEMIN